VQQICNIIDTTTNYSCCNGIKIQASCNVNISAFFKDDKEFAQKLLDAERLSVLPGSVFGAGTTGHIRLSLVQPEDVLSEGCNRLERFLKALT